ncbi:2TM domain-containing protein [uncultured Eudoraea sp.]|uniref:2TM domain-containing protein n=1 Tax=uncultured Eudoraea sp. TaxID=1035614 RepID=UPI0026278AA3|nr:2TM domain-containing protein [uncultured Eudoraea sp.]
MFSENKSDTKIELEQHEQLEYAHKRIKQKKNLYVHFVLFLIGSIFLILINKVLKYGEEYNWFVWAITVWAFLLVVHVINVFVIQKFMGIEWEREQRQKLVAKQRQRIKELQKEIESDFPLSNFKKKD